MHKRYLAFLLLLIGSLAMASDIEEPGWTLIERLGKVEIRQYEATIQAQTVLAGSRETTAGFRRLAGFIFGGNNRSQKIAMTAPVEESLTAQPVMAFTMPSAYRMSDLPQPSDDQVVLREIPPRTMATIRFSGWATRGRIDSNSRRLMAVLADHGIEPLGEPRLNQYNPPWTPPFLRRNEISIEVAALD